MPDPARLAALVDTLVVTTTKGGEAAALLVQKNTHDAVLLVSDIRATTFFFLHDDTPLTARMQRALATERTLVVEGVANDIAVVVLFGETVPAELPARHDDLRCQIAYLHLTPTGELTKIGPAMKKKKPLPQDRVSAAVQRAITEALAKKVTATEQALRDSEREGEHVLAAEGDYDRRVGSFKKTFWKMSAVHIAALWILLFIVQSAFGGIDLWPAAMRMGGFDSEAIAHGSLYLLLSAGLLHASVQHVGGNLYGLLYSLPLHLAIGGGRYLALYVVGCTGGFVGALIAGERFGVGGSGGVFALLTALVLLARKQHEFFPPRVRRGVYISSAVYLGLNVIFTFQPGVSIGGHFGGAVIGAIAVWSGLLTFRLPQLDRGTDESALARRRSRRIGHALLALMITSVIIASIDQQPWALRTPGPVIRYPIADSTWSLALPEGFAAPVVERKHEDTAVRVGHVMRDAYAIIVEHAPAGTNDTLEALRDARASKGTSPGEKWVTQPEIVTRGAKQYVYYATKKGEIMDERWITVIAGRRVKLDIGYWKGASDAWKAWAAKGPDVLVYDE